jgi:fatty acid desaturase
MSHRDGRELLTGLRAIRPDVYWTDLLLSAALGWSASALAVAAMPWSLASLCAAVVAVLALYRALCFVHELSHNRHRLPGFEAAWNLLVGAPLLLPSYTYADVHFDHHRCATYGTSADPEYLPFSRSAWLIIAFALHALVLPVAMLLRFLVLGPVSLAVPRLERVLVVNASAITMRMDYRRELAPKLVASARQAQWLILAVWTPVAALLAFGMLPLRAVWVWLAVTTGITFINAIRTLAAHRYESAGEPLSLADQRADSNDVPGGPWTELWAPVGLRYHAIHHCFPSLPYHALPKAYRVLTAALPEIYGQMTRPHLVVCLGGLCRKGLRRGRR